MSDDLLRELAVRTGVAPHWTDQSGQSRAVAPETLRAILHAGGIPVASEAEIREALALGERSDVRLRSNFTTARVGMEVEMPWLNGSGRTVDVTLEGGGRLVVQPMTSPAGTICLPAFAEPGYHRVHAPDGDVTVAVAPSRCVTFGELGEGGSGWGLAAQIYSLRSEGDGGIGTFAGVASLGRAAAARGADVLAISPVHALYGSLPEQFSPYSPSTRLFYNPLHADPSGILSEALIAQVVSDGELAGEMARLAALPQVDWPQASALRWRLLRGLFEAVRGLPRAAPARRAFEVFAQDASPLLRDHAIFEALHATQVRRDPAMGSWRNWPEALRDASRPEVAAFAAGYPDEVDYQIFLQWLTGASYGQAQRACREAGMAVGLIADLAIGMDGAGSHAWSRPDEVMVGLSIGAPPDYYSTTGQNWGLTTFSPRGLIGSGFAPFIETLRASLRHVGGIRIDHVMGMSRLWLIPEGAGALDGAYVSLPSEELFRLVALESWRHSAIVIGEDLGTLPYGFRDYLREQGVAGLRVLRFERTQHGYVAPRDWDAQAAALTSTHDLVPTAGWWAGSDLADAPDEEEHERVRAWDRGVLWGAMCDADVAAGDRPAADDTDPVVDAVIAYVAATPCALKIIPIEDALGIRVQPNVPGTTVEKPNWRHRLDGAAGSLLDAAPVERRLGLLRR